MRRSMTLGLIVASAFLINAIPAYAQRWGREATPRAGVCFYQDINYSGPYFCTPVGSSTANVPSDINDRISSIRVFGNAAVTVYQNPNLRGSSRTINSNMNDLRSMGFNDRISSYQVDVFNGNAYPNYPSSGVYSPRAVPRNGPYGNNGVYGNAPYGTVQPNASRWNYRDAENVVRRSYRDILGRDPDASGLRSWTQQVVNNNWTQQDLERALRQSDEYRQLRANRRR